MEIWISPLVYLCVFDRYRDGGLDSSVASVYGGVHFPIP